MRRSEVSMKSKLQRQHGVVLVVALVMLLVMTGVGVTVMSGATLQERMAGNNQQLALARMNAEGALRQAEQALTAMNITSTANTHPLDVIATEFNPENDGRFVDFRNSITTPADTPANPSIILSDQLNDNLSVASSWTSNNSVFAAATGTSTTAPRYTIEYIGRLDLASPDDGININDDKRLKETSAPYVFRITAIGFGANQDIYSVLQSTYSTGTN